jgi:hypothetical protein
MWSPLDNPLEMSGVIPGLNSEKHLSISINSIKLSIQVA